MLRQLTSLDIDAVLRLQKEAYISPELNEEQESIYSLVMSLALAFPIVVMANTCVAQTLVCWGAYVALAGISLLYDVLALGILIFARVRNRQAATTVSADTDYGSLFKGWLFQDSLIMVVSVSIYIIRFHDWASDMLMAVVFVATTLASLFFDIIYSHPDLYLSDSA